MTAFRPYFTAEGVDGLILEVDETPSVGPFAVTIDLAARYFLADPTLAEGRSIWTELVTKLNASPMPGTFSVSFPGLSDNTGVAGALSYTGGAFTLGGGTTTVDLATFGFADGVGVHSAPLGILAIAQHPLLCWFPKIYANELAPTPLMWRTTTAGPTEDGSTVTVNHDAVGLGTIRPAWKHVQLDGAVGVRAARVHYRRLADPTRDWRTAAGITTFAPGTFQFGAALDGPSGFWEASCSGRRFLYVVDEEKIGGSYNPLFAQGPHRIIVSPEAPVDMGAWYGMRDPLISRSGAGGGRRNVELAFFEVT